ncbi:protein-L-isoaspartate O-methyltransferase family protein [Angustibacter peucedani]
MPDRATPPDAVDRAFAAAPRTGFLPRAQVSHAHEDHPLAIGYGQTSSQPSTVRTMLRLLDVRAGHRVLDVGAGSGWTTALLAHLVGPQGCVVGVELEPDLALWAASNLAAQAVPWASVTAADPERLGRPELAPFDRVLVSAQAATLPAALVQQLADDGVMVCPVAGRMARVERVPGCDEPAVPWHGSYRFVPLRGPG